MNIQTATASKAETDLSSALRELGVTHMRSHMRWRVSTHELMAVEFSRDGENFSADPDLVRELQSQIASEKYGTNRAMVLETCLLFASSGTLNNIHHNPASIDVFLRTQVTPNGLVAEDRAIFHDMRGFATDTDWSHLDAARPLRHVEEEEDPDRYHPSMDEDFDPS